MPYKSTADLPKAVKHGTTKHGKRIFRAAFNAASKQYPDEETAYKVAWGAVKKAGEHKEKKDGGKSIPVLFVPTRGEDPTLIVPLEKAADFERARRIGRLVKKDYGHDDGSDLAYNLMYTGAINESHSDKEAARIVAQHIEQA